jgi:hypothetical protein
MIKRKPAPKPTLEELRDLAIKFNSARRKTCDLQRELERKFKASERDQIAVYDECHDRVIHVFWGFSSFGSKQVEVTQTRLTRE